MAFENGYNIIEYIQNTVKKFENDKDIFNKATQILNIFMNRSDWPYCYTEYNEISKSILGDDCEWISKYYGQFSSQSELGHELLIDWDKGLSAEFKEEWEIFSKIIGPIVNQYYDYINNPLGIKALIQINKHEKRKIIRIIRNDKKYIDLNLQNHDIKNLADALLEMIDEG